MVGLIGIKANLNSSWSSLIFRSGGWVGGGGEVLDDIKAILN